MTPDAKVPADEEEELRLWSAVLYEDAPDGVVVSVGRSIVFANRRACDLLDCGEDGLLGRSPLDLHPPRQRTRILGELRRMDSTGRGRPPHAEEIARRDGRLLPVEVLRIAVSVGEVPAVVEVLRSEQDAPVRTHGDA